MQQISQLRQVSVRQIQNGKPSFTDGRLHAAGLRVCKRVVERRDVAAAQSIVKFIFIEQFHPTAGLGALDQLCESARAVQFTQRFF